MTFYYETTLEDRQPVAQMSATVGSPLLAVARAAGIELEATCAGKGRCGQCRVRAVGDLAPVTPTEEKVLSKEELADNIRLACQAKVVGDVEVWVPRAVKGHRILSSGLAQEVEIAPAVQKECVTVAKPSLEDDYSDAERLQMALGASDRLSLDLLQALPLTLRQENHLVTVVKGAGELLGIEPGDTTDRVYGIAFDIGTTTVVGSLVDLKTGRELAVHSALNGQVPYGADVISRINYTVEEAQGLATLQRAIIATLNEIIQKLVAETKINAEEIYQVVVVGNTCMQHLLLGIPPRYLAEAPYSPCFRDSVSTYAKDLGLAVFPRALVQTLPNIAGYVGGDTVGVLLATDLQRKEEPTLMVDIGTNGEIALAWKGRILACSTAAGPAFEGAQIRQGMRAAPGAIEGVRLGPEDVELQVIGNEEPVGICGSGLLDAVAELLRRGLLDSTGRLLQPEQVPADVSDRIKNRLIPSEGGVDFVLAWGPGGKPKVTLTQGDIRQFQLAKGAIYSGITVLLKEMGVTVEELGEVLLAGAFGNYLDKKSAVTVGLLPKISPAKITSVGNAARTGAYLALASKKLLGKAQEIARGTVHVELSGRWDFQETFMEAMMFPDYAEVAALF